MLKSLSKVWSAVSTAIVILVVVLAVFLVGSRIAGFRVFNVISGSMEPEYSVGDLIYVKEVDPTEIEVGDPITFVLNEELTVATHRVVGVDAANQHFYTQGDANKDVDASPVHFKNVIGVPVMAVPYLGYVSDFVQNPPGMYITIAVGILLIALVFLPDFLRKGKNRPVADVTSVSDEKVDGSLTENEAVDETEPKASITVTKTKTEDEN